jgi:hypothetical protein
MSLPTSLATISFIDRFNKPARTEVHSTNLTAGNFAAQQTALTNFVTAVTGVSLLTQIREGNTGMIVTHAPVPPTATDAVRSSKYLVRFVDQITGFKGMFEIPGSDLSLVTATNPFMDLTAGAGAALKTAAEAFVLSRMGNAITVTTVEYVPRSS